MRESLVRIGDTVLRESCPIGQVVGDKLREFNAVMPAKSVPSMLHCANGVVPLWRKLRAAQAAL